MIVAKYLKKLLSLLPKINQYYYLYYKQSTKNTNKRNALRLEKYTAKHFCNFQISIKSFINQPL